MSWAQPEWLAGLLSLPVLILVLAVAGWLHRRKLRKVLSKELLERVLPRRVRVRRTLRDIAVVLAAAALFVALAEPRFDKQVRTLQSRGTDIVLLLDLSRSMDARDVDPSRLERARREIEDLGRQLEGDRVGLVVFAGGAYPRLPLTADFKAVQLVVGEATTDTFDTQGSNLAAAIRTGIELLDRSQEHAGQALLVLSDGETHDPKEAIAAANLAVDRKVPIFAMGIGDQPAPIPLPDGRFLQWKGDTVTSTPDFDTLKQVARLTGGAFVTSSAGSKDMESLYSEIRRSVKAVERTSQQRETYRSAFQLPLGLGLALLLFAGWLGEGRLRLPGATRATGAAARRAAAALVVVGFGLLATPARADDPLLEADELYRSGKFGQAAEKLVELSLEHPEDADLLQRLGAARYRSGDFEGAARAFDQAARVAAEPGDSLFDAGNAEYQAGRLEDAKSRYEQVLAADPDNAAAKQNRDLVEKEIAARRAAKPPPPPQGGGDQQQQKSGDQGQQDQPKPQPGDKSQGQPKDSKSGQPQPGDPQQPQPGQDQQGSKSDQPPDQQGSQAVDPSQVGDPNGKDPTQAGQASATGDQTGPITAGQAERLLDSVDEGNQRMVFEGNQEQEPW